MKEAKTASRSGMPWTLKPIVAMGLAAAALALTRPAAAEDVTLMFDWVPSGGAASWYYGVEKGCFSQSGLNVSLRRGFGGVDTVTKIAAGAAEFGLADLGTLMLGRARSNAQVVAIM